MPNGLSDIATAQATPGRLVTVPGQRLFSPVKHARFLITALASHVINDYHELGKIMEAGYQIVPEQCRIRHVTGTYSLTSQIQSVNAAGAATAVTAALAHANGTAASALGFAAASNAEPAILDNTTMLRLAFTAAPTTAPAAGNQFIVEVAYRTIEA